MMKLNLGCGYVQPNDWVNIDKLDYGQEYIIDIVSPGTLKPMRSNTYDFVLMNHALQMFHYDELPIVLKEVRRVMKPGATLRILTPDLVKAFNAVVNKDFDYFPISNEIESTLAGKFARYLFWHGDTRCAFDVSSLTDLLKRNGLRKIERAEFGECELDSREKESLIITCQK